ncbi:MAG TPA: recombinase family protein, partial [Pseudonocardiaceae bacterium]|nr:recombinase family protein [Pseudonocardiaceae bacterium]
MSLDRSGRARSLEEQHADHHRTAAEHGWILEEDSYRDASISASRYSRKARDGFDRLIADLDADRFGAQMLMLWESSRGSRRVGEWVNMLDLCEQRGIRIHVFTHNRTYDPANGRDRRSLLEDAVDSEYESSKMSARMRRAVAANAVAGRPGGRIPFGYRRVFDPRTRQLIAQEPEPAEAAVVAELYRRLIQGHSLRAIARDFQARCIRTRTGRVFSAEHLRSVALSPVYAALRAHRPTGHSGGRHAVLPVEQLYEGQWPAVVPRADWLAVQRLLRSPERKTSRPGRGKHLLSLIAHCGRCGGTVAVAYRRGRSEYFCRTKGCIRIPQHEVDELAEQIMLDYLARPEVIDSLRVGEQHDDRELGTVREQLAIARTRHEELADAVAAGTLSVALAARSEPAILVEIQRLEQREKDLATPSALRGLIEPGADVARRWHAAPMSTRRQIAKLLLTPELLGQLQITPSPTKGHRPPVEDRIQWW